MVSSVDSRTDLWYKAGIENEIIMEIGSISENIIPADASAVKAKIDKLKDKRLEAAKKRLDIPRQICYNLMERLRFIGHNNKGSVM